MRPARGIIEVLGIALCFVTLFLNVVLPNSLRSLSAVSLVTCFIVTLPRVHFSSIKSLVGFHCLSALITCFYLLVGIQNGAPPIVLGQTIIVYVLSPIMWLFIFSSLLQSISDELLAKWFIFFTTCAALSVGLFFYLFLTAGADSVRVFVQDPNVTFADGDPAATMHVFGSMIFLLGGLFAAPDLVRSPIRKIALSLIVLLAAFASGRSALILAPFIGFGIGFVYRRLTVQVIPLNTAAGAVLSMTLFAIGMPFLMQQFEFNLLTIFEKVHEEVSDVGGTERREQFTELVKGIIDSNGIGLGHGIGVSYLRNDDFPWRYELIWVATVLRVGLFGAVVYCLPFIYYLKISFDEFRQGRLNDFDLYFLAGFLLSFLATNTNPYIEGYAFHWMYTLPLVRACYLRHIR